MLTNYWKIAWRHLLKDRQFTVLNLIGLATGLACILLIGLWIYDETHIDHFNAKGDRIYQVLKSTPDADGTLVTRETTQGLLASSMAAELPEVEAAVSVFHHNASAKGIIAAGEQRLKAELLFADKDFFRIFSYPILEGNKEHPLSDEDGVLLSDKLARKLFNTTEGLVGKTISWNAGDSFDGVYSIRGVYTAPPSNASDQFDLVFTYALFTRKMAGTMGDISFWGSNSIKTYLLLKPGVDARVFNEKVKDYTRKKIATLYARNADLLKYEGTLLLQRYSDKYLHNHYENGAPVGGRIEYVRLFSLIAGFILLIACINFMNLSTAKSASRIKEIGVQKMLGAGRGRLIGQYLGESILLAFGAMILALLLSRLLLPAFQTITGKDLHLPAGIGFFMSLFGIVLFTGLLAGAYPALYLSGFRSSMVLKSGMVGSSGKTWVRKGLVVFQFTLSTLLIVSVWVIYQQMQLVQNKNLGYDKDNTISFTGEGKLQKDLGGFLTVLRNIPGVRNASDMDGNMTVQYSQAGGGISWEGRTLTDGIEFTGLDMDYGMMDLLGLRMIKGRGFSPAFGTDSTSVIFNETAIAAMRLKDPVGKTVSLWGKPRTIIGVVRDFQFGSLYKKVAPFFLRYSPGNNTIYVRIEAGKTRETLARIAQFYGRFNDGLPFEYTFMDEDYKALYNAEQTVAMLSRYFAGLAILISCLGLFGLVAFAAQKRQKEVGIRKVVGASVSNIVFLLSKDFLRLVSLSLVIAFPVAWWVLNHWLEGFAYRVSIGPVVFLLTGGLIFLIAMLTISLQSIRAALANPVDSLRTE
ncbi:MAG: ABC transporter permease [Bacteroidetes bacterium]|nr:ABC transporter permease [Bacteroidota bacterium]